MSSAPAPPKTEEFRAEATFKAYTPEQAARYAQARSTYHPNLFKRIVDHHVATGGQLGTLVDVGCGPGIATRALAPRFATAFGLDASAQMIDQAQKLGGVCVGGEAVRFELSTAEDLGDGSSIADGSVDLITAATAAHWFDLARFWPRAAQLLRPGGTVAFWTGNYMQAHPSMPNAEALSAVLETIEKRELEPYMEPGNLLGRDLYVNLPLPWTLSDPVTAFDPATLFRKEWGTPGQDDAEAPGNEFFIDGQREMTLDRMELALGTASPVTRWREANPDKVGTDKDVIKVIRSEITRLLHEAGVPEGQEVVKGRFTGVLLMVKKKADSASPDA